MLTSHVLTIILVFGRVHMLYINAEVNGHPVKAFVDSGAQATVMSPSCAEECGIMRYLDTRWSGMAMGVGTAKILGRVHHAEIAIGGAVMPCSFTVMEGKDVDLLFGLDMLKRYKAKIDLEKNALCFEGIEVPFLAEHEIPKRFFEAELNEPTIPGPDGTEIGGYSGAVRPAGETSKAASKAAEEEKKPLEAPPKPSSSASQAAPSDEFPLPDIERLIQLGFPRQAAIQALRAANGDVNLAAQLLMEST
jgi:DNA damage-inducible protein 1